MALVRAATALATAVASAVSANAGERARTEAPDARRAAAAMWRRLTVTISSGFLPTAWDRPQGYIFDGCPASAFIIGRTVIPRSRSAPIIPVRCTCLAP